MNMKLKNIGVTIGATGYFGALISVLIAYPRYYTDVIAPAKTKQGFFIQMFIIGAVVAAAAALVFLLLKKLRSPSANKNIAVALFGIFTAALPLVTPYGLSLLGQKVNWMTPTIVGNALSAAYAVYIVLMLLAGVSLTLVCAKLHDAAKTTCIPAAVTGIFTLLAAGIVTVVTRMSGYDLLFYVAGAVTVLAALIGALLEIAAGRQKS